MEWQISATALRSCYGWDRFLWRVNSNFCTGCRLWIIFSDAFPVALLDSSMA
ncbi:hypothetical protein M6B38_162945 [Iris pallida]|uniref:Uncharacterized protein n=1 Tax=Iris pallida TaxID=29817 RepID=A0AAX6EZW0_IRIPA|nr:hypothetical protein M6B38_162945 [Iris pallida]